MKSGALKIAPSGDRELVMTRYFFAPCGMVFDALTKPDQIKQWLLGPPGWSMPTCEVALKVGGAYRYVWKHTNGEQMGVGGVYKEIARPDRIVHTERFDKAWYAGEAVLTTSLVEKNGKTMLTVTIRYESEEARDAVLKSRMEEGVSASYDALEDLLGSSGNR
jgi:uncharacterized protein YndB with AHSA1/START domain